MSNFEASKPCSQDIGSAIKSFAWIATIGPLVLSLPIGLVLWVIVLGYYISHGEWLQALYSPTIILICIVLGYMLAIIPAAACGLIIAIYIYQFGKPPFWMAILCAATLIGVSYIFKFHSDKGLFNPPAFNSAHLMWLFDDNTNFGFKSIAVLSASIASWHAVNRWIKAK